MPPRDPAIATQTIPTPMDDVREKIMEPTIQHQCWKEPDVLPGYGLIIYACFCCLCLSKCVIYICSNVFSSLLFRYKGPQKLYILARNW